MEQITSLKNEYIKQLCRLKTVSGRREQEAFMIEGQKLCEEAISSGQTIERCLFTQSVSKLPLLSSLPSDQLLLISDTVASKLSSLETAPGIFMVLKPKEISPPSDAPFILALDHLADPANLGAILRSAEAFGARMLFCSEGCVDLYSPKVLRGAMGSVFRVPVLRGDLISFINLKKEEGYRILGAGLNRHFTQLPDLSFQEPTVMVIGNESNGISVPVMSLCHGGVFIPMRGNNESLNAAVAASILLWEQSKWR